tara:strand:- start:58 stop:489 length:432 start_codon:yes stop_codon:yes gene_type:complete
MMNRWEHFRKDDYQYKLDRMVDDYLVDNEIGIDYEDYFIRSRCSYNGTRSDMLFVEFYFRPKNKWDSKLPLIKTTFGEENLDEIITQNGMKMKVVVTTRQKRNGETLIEGDGDTLIEGVGFFTTKEWIDEEIELEKTVKNEEK